MKHSMQTITPFLWFNREAEAAARFYTSVFKTNSKIIKVTRYPESGAKASGHPANSVMTVAFQLNGQEFTALNGGPHFKINGAISFVVRCRTQAEIDYYWKKLSAGGKEIQCGWLEDKFGVTWQIVPAILGDLVGHADPAKRERVMEALLNMVKLDVQKLKQAARGGNSTRVARRKKS